ncbi:MAG: efflux RND transporter periplasmic adaptor subunit [Planctomycetota bacterium]
MNVSRQRDAEPPVRLRWRGDLVSESRWTDGRRRWVVHDPLARRYFLFQQEEFYLATLLDGVRGMGAIGREFTREFPLLKFDARRCQLFFGRLHRDGLVLSDVPGQAAVWSGRQQKSRRSRWLAAPGSILACRLPGWNPDGFLDRLYPWVSWFFSVGGVVAGLLLMLVALLLLAGHWSELPARMPTMESLFAPQQWAILAIILALTKVGHELGHALTCKHFGGRCSEMGVMFLVFTPCLYCDVGDAWLIPGRWRRAAVAAAGVYVELLIAAGAVLCWWYCRSPWWQNVWFLVVTVCGVSTLVFNANPLLRYDGYFILADFLDLPNLWLRAREQVLWLGKRLVFSRLEPSEVVEPHPWFMAVYGLSATVYRWFVFAACLAFILQVTRRWELSVLGPMVCVTSGVGMVVPGIRGLYTFFSYPHWQRSLTWSRLGWLAGLATGLGLLIAYLPLPYRVSAAALVQIQDAQPVYVTVPGTLQEAVVPGTRVTAGETIARLENLALQRELVRWRGELRIQQARVAALEAQRGDEAAAGNRLPAARETLAGLRQVVEQRERDQQRLELVAPVDGLVLPPTEIPAPPPDGTQLPAWSGTPTERRNLGAELSNGTLVAWIAPRLQWEATLYVTESDVELLREGQAAAVMVKAWPGNVLRGHVAEISPMDLKRVPEELLAEAQIPYQLDAAGKPRPLETHYQVRVTLTDAEWELVNRLRGEAKIQVPPQSLGYRAWRWARSWWAGPR